jgi:hypothetical protein
MKIAVLAGGFWHEAQLSEALESIGHEVLLLNPTTLRKLRPIRGLFAHAILRGSNKFRWLEPLSRAIYFICTRALIRKFEANIVVAWSSFALEYLTFESKPVVIVRGSTHIRDQRTVFDTFPRDNNLLIEKGPSRYIVSRELSEYEKALMVTIPTDEILSSPNWFGVNAQVNPYGFAENGPPLLTSSFDGIRTLRAMFAGQTSLRKGIDRLSYLASGFSNLIVEVYGPMVQPRNAFESTNVRYKGLLQREDLLMELARHDLFILLSREEGMARAGMESISAGIPVLVTEETGLKIWCEKGAGICLPRDFTQEDFRAALEKIQTNKSQYKRKCLQVSKSWTWVDHAVLLVAQIEGSLEKQGKANFE